jgi:hypothetical protein
MTICEYHFEQCVLSDADEYWFRHCGRGSDWCQFLDTKRVLVCALIQFASFNWFDGESGPFESAWYILDKETIHTQPHSLDPGVIRQYY